MSYCRWSSNDYTCDVYVYEDVNGGWTTHVAARRHDFDRSALPQWPEPTREGLYDVAAHLARHSALMAALEMATLAPIGLPHDGESFTDDTPGDCADRLESLRALGYIVPQSAIDALREEQAAEQAPAGAGRGADHA